MAFYEEKMSKLEALVGRRFPLAIILIAATCLMGFYGFESIANAFVVVVGIVITGYYKDIGQEKKTIKLVADETELAYNPKTITKPGVTITEKEYIGED
jgi:hypothetical protein